MQYKGVHKPLRQIARELNVDAVVEGTVMRSGDRVRITAQLIQVASDRHLWANAYEGDLSDILTLQNQVAAVYRNRATALADNGARGGHCGRCRLAVIVDGQGARATARCSGCRRATQWDLAAEIDLITRERQ